MNDKMKNKKNSLRVGRDNLRLTADLYITIQIGYTFYLLKGSRIAALSLQFVIAITVADYCIMQTSVCRPEYATFE